MKSAGNAALHLRSIEKKSSPRAVESFPFNLELIKKFTRIDFHRPVTFFVGENGSGKSTLLEAIAAGVGSITVGGDDVQLDHTLEHARKLASQFRFVWHKRTTKGFFLRAEDFFNFARRINRMSAELEDLAASYDERFTGYALGLAKGAVLGQRRALAERYGEDADARSHGESFLHLFQSRFVPGGLYLLDEPEAPLSPLRQLSLLSMLKDMVSRKAQFIIATHSPILMAFPEASIVSFDTHPVKEVAYEDIEHVNLTRLFLNNPEAFLRRL
ncbi:MAG TPA: AAA family ATPase [Blastocatellia bacterium]|nr:AAA family ATPase [Blastocatellia bacterium]